MDNNDNDNDNYNNNSQDTVAHNWRLVIQSAQERDTASYLCQVIHIVVDDDDDDDVSVYTVYYIPFCHNNHVQGGIEYQSNRTACVKDKKIVKCKKFLHEKLSSRCVGISFSEAVLMTGYI